MRDRMSHEWGVINFLQEKGFRGRRGVLNKVLVEFLKQENIRYEKHNPRYKGTYDAFCINSTRVQEVWTKFHTYINKNKPLTVEL
jgi:hypothetical protein